MTGEGGSLKLAVLTNDRDACRMRALGCVVGQLTAELLRVGSCLSVCERVLLLCCLVLSTSSKIKLGGDSLSLCKCVCMRQRHEHTYSHTDRQTVETTTVPNVAAVTRATLCTFACTPRSTQPCIRPRSLNRVPASAGVKAGISPLPGGR